MKTNDFYYNLPEELIAQTPIYPRDMSRLMVLSKTTGVTEHKTFRDIIDMLNKGDCLVLNDTRVLPARIFGTREDTGSVVEFVPANPALNKVRSFSKLCCFCSFSIDRS